MQFHFFVKITYNCPFDKIEIFGLTDEQAKDPMYDDYRKQTIITGIKSFHYMGYLDRYRIDTAIILFAQLQIYYKP